MGDIGPAQRRYEVLPVRAPGEPARRAPEPAAEPQQPAPAPAPN